MRLPWAAQACAWTFKLPLNVHQMSLDIDHRGRYRGPQQRANRIARIKISELLRHRGRQLSQASRPDAKNMAASKVPVAHDALQAHTRPRVDV